MIEFRKTDDMECLLKWRREVLGAVFGTAPTETLMQNNMRYYRKHILNGSHQAFIATLDGKDAGCGAVCLYDELPSPDNPGGRCAYFMNIYVRQEFRNRGIAHAIVTHLVEVAKSMDCDKIYLESTEMAKSLYLGLGFKDMKDMMKYGNS